MDKKITLVTGHNHAFHRVSSLAALENGYFRDEGLMDVSIGASGEDSLTVKGLKSGEVDFGIDVKPGLILEENGRGEQLYIIAGMLNNFDLTLIGARDIKSIADLRNKKIGLGMEGGGREVAWIRMLLRKEGIDPDKDISWVTNSGYGSLNMQGPRLDRGDYQATWLSGHYKRPELFELIRKAGYNILAERSETHPDGLPDRVVATTGKMLEDFPLVVKKVLKGIVRGYRFARDPKNAAKAREMYLAYDWGKDGFGWGKFDDSLLDGMVSSARYLPADGSVSQSGLEALIEEYKTLNKLPGSFTKQQVLKLEILQEAVQELNSKFGPEGY